MVRAAIAVLAAGALCGQSMPASAASMEDELRGLVTQHPRIQSNQAQVGAADKGVSASLAPFLPSVDITGGYGYEHVSTPAFRHSTGPFETEGAQNYSATVKENVFDGGKKTAN